MSSDWLNRHTRAWTSPESGHERAVVGLIRSWLEYAEAHESSLGSNIGEDGYLGDEWRDIGLALRGLLNGETGRLDCGTLDRAILDALESAGFKEEDGFR